MHQSLYTFIMEYRNGTYLSQCTAENEQIAMKSWAESLDINSIQHLDNNIKNTLIQEAKNEELTPISNTKNVWCGGFLINDHYALLHVVKTEQSTKHVS